MGDGFRQNITIFAEFVNACKNHELGDFIRKNKISSALLTSKVQSGNIHGSAWQTMLGHAIAVNQLSDVVSALENRNDKLTADQLRQCTRGGIGTLVNYSSPEQARLIARIILESGESPSYNDIIAEPPNTIDNYVVSSRFDTIMAFLDELGHTLSPPDIFRDDSSNRCIFYTALCDSDQSEALIKYLKEHDVKIPMAELERFYATSQTFLGSTPRTLMAAVVDKGNGEALLKLPLADGEEFTKRQLADIIGAMPSGKAARDFLTSRHWNGRTEEHKHTLDALLESTYAKNGESWVYEFLSQVQIHRTKKMLTNKKRRRHVHKHKRNKPALTL